VQAVYGLPAFFREVEETILRVLSEITTTVGFCIFSLMKMPNDVFYAGKINLDRRSGVGLLSYHIHVNLGERRDPAVKLMCLFDTRKSDQLFLVPAILHMGYRSDILVRLPATISAAGCARSNAFIVKIGSGQWRSLEDVDRLLVWYRPTLPTNKAQSQLA